MARSGLPAIAGGRQALGAVELARKAAARMRAAFPFWIMKYNPMAYRYDETVGLGDDQGFSRCSFKSGLREPVALPWPEAGCGDLLEGARPLAPLNWHKAAALRRVSPFLDDYGVQPVFF